VRGDAGEQASDGEIEAETAGVCGVEFEELREDAADGGFGGGEEVLGGDDEVKEGAIQW
jgi:hypothetical protein